MITYKIFENTKKGFMASREPITISVKDELVVSFENAPNNATVIFEDVEGKTLYKRIINKECRVPAMFLTGELKVAVVVFSGDTPKYQCESIFGKRFGEQIIVCPNGIDTPVEIVNIYAEMETLKQGNKALQEELAKANRKLEKILEGYDFD
jgi:hypothetical protein